MSNDTTAILSDGLSLLRLLKFDTLDIHITDVIRNMQEQEITIHRRFDAYSDVLPLSIESEFNTWARTPGSQIAIYLAILRTFNSHCHLVSLA